MLFWLTAWRRKGCILLGGLEHVSGVLRPPWVDGLLELRSMTNKKILLSLWTNSYIYQIPSPLTAISRKKEATLDWKLQSGIPSTGSQAIPSEKTETKPVKLQKLLRQGSVLQSTCTEFHPVALSALTRKIERMRFSSFASNDGYFGGASKLNPSSSRELDMHSLLNFRKYINQAYYLVGENCVFLVTLKVPKLIHLPSQFRFM